MRISAFCTLAVFVTGLSGFAEGPTFDVASVKMADRPAQPPPRAGGGPGTDDPSRFSDPYTDMFTLLRKAFDVEEDQISGPSWLRDLPPARAFYTVVATMPPDTTKEQFQKMLQNLLVERFHLVFHRETRNFPGYALVVDKDGPKFKEVTPTQGPTPDRTGDPRSAVGAPRGEDGFRVVPGSIMLEQFVSGGQRVKYQERTMAEFISNLGFVIASSLGKEVLQGAPQPRVVDKTGLTGKYTFILEYYDAGAPKLGGGTLVRRGQAAGADSAPGNASPPAPSEPGSALPNIFTAIQKQLGLRLDKMPDVPVDFIVIDSVDKTPTAN